MPAKKNFKKSVKKIKKSVKPVKKPVIKVVKKLVKPAKKVFKKVEKPTVRYVRSKPPSEDEIEKLLQRGQNRGFVTENEILMTFSEVEDYLTQYEDFLDKLERIGIHFVEMKEGILGQRKQSEAAFET
ncbi:MAG: YD repeat protein, partial [Candidatus Uhrbacteria bacterium GW2011_GWF2_44_350]